MAARFSRASGVLSNLGGTLRDFARQATEPAFREILRAELGILPPALSTTLPWLVKARGERDESLVKVVQQNAERDPGGLALEMDEQRLSWSALDAATSRVAHVLAGLGVRSGEVVALVGKNSPDYVVNLLGASRVGATVALINHHLEGAPLSHAIRSSKARVVLAERGFDGPLAERDDLKQLVERVLVFREGDFDAMLAEAPAVPFERATVSVSDDYVYIYTSGTTGLPKPCRVSHARSLIVGAAFGPLLFGFEPGDKLYSVLPLYHSSAMLIGLGSCIMSGTPMALRESFSTRAFWPDVQRYQATAILYIGELCRYLVNSPESDDERPNPVKVAVGNGLRADVWEAFQERFEIPTIREFYSATEAPGAIFNLTGKVGSIGHVPMRRLGPLKLARYDVEADQLVRDEDGFCIECGPDQVGELLIRLKDKPRSALGEFKGYTDEGATKKKILHGVFEPGDQFYRSGDLMRFDDNDYFYFVDRIGDTYRWKGENVSTAEVAEVISQAPGILEATVTGVHVPGAEGQAGLAAVVSKERFDAEAFARVAHGLPSYARPRFVRVLEQLDTTGTFKIQKTQLQREGVDPGKVQGELYVLDGEGYVPLDEDRWQAIIDGRLRL